MGCVRYVPTYTYVIVWSLPACDRWHGLRNRLFIAIECDRYSNLLALALIDATWLIDAIWIDSARADLLYCVLQLIEFMCWVMAIIKVIHDYNNFWNGLYVIVKTNKCYIKSISWFRELKIIKYVNKPPAIHYSTNATSYVMMTLLTLPFVHNHTLTKPLTCHKS